MIIAKKVDKNKEKTEHFLICSVFLCFSSIIFDFLQNDFWGKSDVFVPLPQFGQAVEVIHKGNLIHPELFALQILQLAGRGGKGKDQPIGI